MKKRTLTIDDELCSWLEEYANECHLLTPHEKFRLERYKKKVYASSLVERMIINLRDKLQDDK